MLAEEPRGLTLGFLDDDETEIVGRGGVEEDLAASEQATDSSLTEFQKTYARIPNFK